MIADAAQNNHSLVPERSIMAGRYLGRRAAVRLFQGMADLLVESAWGAVPGLLRSVSPGRLNDLPPTTA